jgi:hypothetical protein
MKRFLSFAFCSAVLFVPSAPAATSPIQVMLMDSQSGGAYHNWRATTPVLKKELEDTGLFQVTVKISPQAAQIAKKKSQIFLLTQYPPSRIIPECHQLRSTGHSGD